MSNGRDTLFPNYAPYPIRFVEGKGSKLWDEQGKEYIDLVTGIAVTGLGHANETVNEALKAQIDRLWHVSNLYEIPGQEKLSKLLTEASCMDKAFFCNSGAEANEAAIKLARRYHSRVANSGRYEIITFHQSFHGRTLATLTATGQDKVKDGFGPLPDGFVHVPYNDVEALKTAVNERTCAIMLEFVQGEGGVRPADPAFIAAVKALCADHKLLLIADEVQSGIGRTGTVFAYEQYGIEPDIISLAKGLGNGFPIGAMLGKAYLAEAFTAGTHGSTFGGTPIACAAASATLETLIGEKLPERAGQLGAKALDRLRGKLAAHPDVVEVRGRGLLIGIELRYAVGDIVKAAMDDGLLILSAGPNVIRLLPALNIPEELLMEALDRVVALIVSSKRQVHVQ